MKITTNEFFIFSASNIRKGGRGIVTLASFDSMETPRAAGFARPAAALMIVADRVANGEAPAGDEFVARAELTLFEGYASNSGMSGSPIVPAFVCHLLRPVANDLDAYVAVEWAPYDGSAEQEDEVIPPCVGCDEAAPVNEYGLCRKCFREEAKRSGDFAEGA